MKIIEKFKNILLFDYIRCVFGNGKFPIGSYNQFLSKIYLPGASFSCVSRTKVHDAIALPIAGRTQLV
jgi:hypothetical protein